jgi:predicted MFS family arabinose efflux permease
MSEQLNSTSRSRRNTIQNLPVQLAVALAFADASIVVLALPAMVDRLHTSIAHVIWVIVSYNLALIVGCTAIRRLTRHVSANVMLVAGLGLFAAASIGCGAVSDLGTLVALRALQGFGGALVVSASLPMFAAAASGESDSRGWAAAAAIGAALGPAAGGVLTQLFSWRAIFFAQAPIAAVVAVAVIVGGGQPARESLLERAGARRRSVDQLIANTALLCLSAGLIGALFLAVIEMISVWAVTSIGAAAVVVTIPLATAISERAARGCPPLVLGAAGAILLAGGLFVLSLITHRQLGEVVLALVLCGMGLGVGFPALTAAALHGRGPSAVRAARTVAARDLGLVLGLLALTPVFVGRLNATTAQVSNETAASVLFARLPIPMKLQLGRQLIAVANSTPDSRLPNFTRVFSDIGAGATRAQRAQLLVLEGGIDSTAQRAATRAFSRPYQYASLAALLVVPLLGFARRANRVPFNPPAM